MIQIDDAGNGTVLGGEAIGALRVETGEYRCKFLPLSAYAHFEIPRCYAAQQAVLQLLAELKHNDGEELVFCTGDIFRQVKNHLTLNKIIWSEEKITGDLQEMVEASFFNSLRDYGLPERFRAFHHDYHKFHNQVLHWVSQDLKHRRQFCKPLRLNSSLITRAKIYSTLLQRTVFCSNCHQEIAPFSEAVFDKSNEVPEYYHLACFPVHLELSDFQKDVWQGQPVYSFINKSALPVTCSVCGDKIKYKRRMMYCNGTFYHFSCYAALQH